MTWNVETNRLDVGRDCFRPKLSSLFFPRAVGSVRSVDMVGRGNAWPNLVGGRLMSQSVRKAGGTR